MRGHLYPSLKNRSNGAIAISSITMPPFIVKNVCIKKTSPSTFRNVLRNLIQYQSHFFFLLIKNCSVFKLNLIVLTVK